MILCHSVSVRLYVCNAGPHSPAWRSRVVLRVPPQPEWRWGQCSAACSGAVEDEQSLPRPLLPPSDRGLCIYLYSYTHDISEFIIWYFSTVWMMNFKYDFIYYTSADFWVVVYTYKALSLCSVRLPSWWTQLASLLVWGSGMTSCLPNLPTTEG